MDSSSFLKARDLVSFIEKSPSVYQTVDNMSQMLVGNGFSRLSGTHPFNLMRGHSYFVTRSSSALIAFRIPENPSRFSIISAHTDSPCFKIKWNPVVSSPSLPGRLNVEAYGGALYYTWLDRPLSMAGRILYADGGTIREKHSDFADRLSLVIPSLCIHQNREANNGWKISVQKEMLPLYADSEVSFLSLLAAECGCREEDIKDYDLFLYNSTPAVFSGVDREYFSVARIDDLECAYTALNALIGASNPSCITVAALFDNEETGSGTMQGALSDFLESVIRRISLALSWNEEEMYMALSSSLALSADNGHAVHPAYPERSDITNRPRMNGGVLLKYCASQKYTTSGLSGAAIRLLLENNGIPYQIFFNNSDIPGGSTLGNLSAQKVSVATCDCGVAQLAMHSSYETAGTEDVISLESFFRAFYLMKN